MEIRSTQNTAEDPEIPARPGWEGMHVWWLVNRANAGSDTLVVNETVIPANKWHEVHRHPHAEEALYVLEGSGLHLTEDGSHRLTQGDVVFIPRNEWHGLANDTDEPAEGDRNLRWGGHVRGRRLRHSSEAAGAGRAVA